MRFHPSRLPLSLPRSRALRSQPGRRWWRATSAGCEQAPRLGSISSACTGRAAARSGSAPGAVSGRWSRWRDAAPEDDRPDAGTRELRARGWQLGSPYWTGPSNRIAVRTFGPRHPGARLLRAEPGQDGRLRGRLDRRTRRSSSPGRAGAQMSESAAAGRGTQTRSGSRSSTTPRARTRTRGLSRPRSSGASSATTCSETAGTTSATTFSSTSTARSSKAATGESTGTSSARMRRASTRARSGIALIGSYEGNAPIGRRPQRADAPHRLAARRRARRPAVDVQLALVRQPALPGGAEHHAAHDLRSSRHGLHDLSRKPALRRAACACARRLRDRAAEALLPGRDRPARRDRAFHGHAHRGASVDGGRHRAGRKRRRHRLRERHGCGLDLGREDGSGRALHVRHGRRPFRAARNRRRHRHFQPGRADRACPARDHHSQRRRSHRVDADQVPPARGVDS